MLTYELAIWDGQRPANDAVALLNYLDLYDQYIESEDYTPPCQRISIFAQALLTRWPAIDDSTNSPWAVNPLEENAQGPIIYLIVARSKAAEVVPFIVQLATHNELVCFD